MQPRSLNLVSGCLIVLGSMVFACSSTPDPEAEQDGKGGSSSSVSKDKKGGAAGQEEGSAGSVKNGSGGGSAGAAGKGSSGSASHSGGSAGASSGAGGKGNAAGGGAAGKAGKGGDATTGAGGKDAVGSDASTSGKGGKSGAPEGGLTEAGHTGVGGSANSDGGGTPAGDGKSAGCGKAPTIASSQYNNGNPISITAAGKQRRWVLSVPKNYDNTKTYKLILTIHARDGNDKQMYNWQYYGLQSLTNDTVIFAAPNGQKNGSPCSGTSSDGDSGCGWPNTNGDDLALMDAVIGTVEDNFCIDTNHIFATGWSYGASMSYEVGCQRPLGGSGSATWGVRAIAIYSGAQMSGSCKPKTPIGFYASHGTHDSVLQYSGGVSLAQSYASVNGCTWATPTQVSSGNHVCTNEAGCKTGYPLEFCSFNGDHTPFPDNGQSQGSWGPQEVWKFLSQF